MLSGIAALRRSWYMICSTCWRDHLWPCLPLAIFKDHPSSLSLVQMITTCLPLRHARILLTLYPLQVVHNLMSRWHGQFCPLERNGLVFIETMCYIYIYIYIARIYSLLFPPKSNACSQVKIQLKYKHHCFHNEDNLENQ